MSSSRGRRALFTKGGTGRGGTGIPGGEKDTKDCKDLKDCKRILVLAVL
jgi:hypothetical protein